MRVEQHQGARGSLKWMQRLVELYPSMVDQELRQVGVLPAAGHLSWLSPLRADNWAEYRDSGFLRLIGRADLVDALQGFWPRRGPQWDALAVDQFGRVFLFEAKAHGDEMASSCKAGSKSRQLIAKSTEYVKAAIGAVPAADWLNGYYQYANRLAHLAFLRENGVDARLVFLYFTGDYDMRGPVSPAEWSPIIDRAHAHLGLKQQLKEVVQLFMPVRDLR